jgi:uncharacterized membrane protein (UPF0127 family)
MSAPKTNDKKMNEHSDNKKSNLSITIFLFVAIIFGSLCLYGYLQGAQTQTEVKRLATNEMLNNADVEIASSRATIASTSAYKTEILTMGGKAFTAEISDTNALRELGLSNRESIAADHAMLFVFPEDGSNLFWMKDMNFSIDMIWLDSNRKIMFIAADASPDSFPKTFGPTAPSRYVIETRAGIAAELGLKVGDRVSF